MSSDDHHRNILSVLVAYYQALNGRTRYSRFLIQTVCAHLTNTKTAEGFERGLQKLENNLAFVSTEIQLSGPEKGEQMIVFPASGKEPEQIAKELSVYKSFVDGKLAFLVNALRPKSLQ